MCSWYVYVYSAVTLLDVRSNATVHNVYSNAPDDKWWDIIAIFNNSISDTCIGPLQQTISRKYTHILKHHVKLVNKGHLPTAADS